VAVKCDITSLVIERLKTVNWGVKCVESNTFGIIESYLEKLDCDSVDYVIRSKDSDCSGTIIVFNCEYNILRIGFTVEESESIFKVNIGDYIGGTPPFTYEWAYEEDDFDLVSSDPETGELKLKLKTGKTFDTLVSQITVTITDLNFCTATKTCYITPGGMMCGNSYVACPNTSELEVVNLFVQCSGPMALTVQRLN
jgi:hypothetical protein